MTTSIPLSSSTTPPTDQSLLFSQSSYCLYKVTLFPHHTGTLGHRQRHSGNKTTSCQARRNDSLDSNSEKDSDEADLGNLSKMVMHGGISIRVYFLLLDCLFILQDKSRTISVSSVTAFCPPSAVRLVTVTATPAQRSSQIAPMD